MLAGQIPEEDRRVRFLLDSGRLQECEAAFDDVIASAPNTIGDQWDRPTVLVHRAILAWRLGRLPLALELAAEGWAELDLDQPYGASTAQTISMLGYIMEGHSAPALALLNLAVQVARESGDTLTLSHCLLREATALAYRSISDDERREKWGIKAAAKFDEIVQMAPPGAVYRRALAGSAKYMLFTDRRDEAEQRAERALELSEEPQDWFCVSIAQAALSDIRRDQGALKEARDFAELASDAANRIKDNLLVSVFSRDLASICHDMGDYSAEAEALRRTIAADRKIVNVLQEGLGQALEQRRVAVQAQRLATAAQEAAARDPLTGLINRRGFERQAPVLLGKAVAQNVTPWLIVLDVDWFKGVNDVAGHAAGDSALQEVANILRRECRSDDLLCRWAGDEFVVLALDSDESKSAGPAISERIRAAIDGHDWELLVGQTTQNPTVSIGVAAGPGPVDELFSAADIALYRAKRAGRNRVEINHNPHLHEPGPQMIGKRPGGM